jgi:hypothetical protein
LFNKEAVGERIIIHNGDLWYEEFFNIIRKNFGLFADKLPTNLSPKWLSVM